MAVCTACPAQHRRCIRCTPCRLACSNSCNNAISRPCRTRCNRRHPPATRRAPRSRTTTNISSGDKTARRRCHFPSIPQHSLPPVSHTCKCISHHKKNSNICMALPRLLKLRNSFKGSSSSCYPRARILHHPRMRCQTCNSLRPTLHLLDRILTVSFTGRRASSRLCSSSSCQGREHLSPCSGCSTVNSTQPVYGQRGSSSSSLAHCHELVVFFQRIDFIITRETLHVIMSSYGLT